MFATDRCHTLDDPWRDAAIAVRFHDEDDSVDAVVRAAGDRPVDGVIAVGDRPVVLAARIAEALGLSGNPPDAAHASANKRLARERFARAGLPVPSHVHITIDSDIQRIARDLSYPRRDQTGRIVRKPRRHSCRRQQRSGRGIPPGVASAAASGHPRPTNGSRARPADRVVHSRTGVCDRRAVDRRHIHAVGALRQARSAGWSVLRRNDLRDAVTRPGERQAADGAARPRARRGRSDCGMGRCTPNAGSGGRSPVSTCSKSRRVRLAGCAHACCDFRRGTAVQSLEHVLLRHAIGEDVSGLRREADAAAVMMIPIPRRGMLRRVAGEDDAAAGCRVSKMCG